MNCIYTQTEYSRWCEGEKTLMVESKTGRSGPLLTGELTFSISDGKYTIANSAGSVLRQGRSDGTPTSIFAIYDSMAIPVESLRVVTADFNGSFDDYEKEYGHGRVDRENVRKFVVYTEKIDDSRAAFGTVERAGGKSQAIHSLFIEGEYSNRDRIKYVAEYIKSMLAPTERANVRAVNLSANKLGFEYRGIVNVYSCRYSESFEEPRILFEDAVARKSSISEVFPDGGSKYDVLGLWPVEEIENEVVEATEVEN